MKSKTLIAAVFFLVALATVGELRAQVPATATGSIAGVVLAADDASRPVPRVIVTATGSGVPAGRSAVTEADGRFAIVGLPAGRYVVAARKPAFLPAVYGATRPGRAGLEVVLADGQHVTEIRIPLIHGAAVSGLIRDASGQPLPSASIAVQRPGPNGLTTAATGLSDDRGQYRVFGLAPGDYLVSALEYSLVQTVAGNMTTAAVDSTLDWLRRFRGGAATAPAAPSVPTVNLAPVFYGGALSADQATPIRLAAGEDRGGVDITVVFARTATVSGVVNLPAGVAAGAATISLLPANISSLPRVGGVPVGRLDADGKFRFPGVNPGRYILDARVGFMPLANSGPQPPKLWGEAAIDVTGDDLPDVSISLRPLLHVTGKIVVDGNASALDLSRLHVNLAGAAPVVAMAAAAGLARPVAPTGPAVAADGTFDIEVSPGTFTYTVGPLPGGWVMRSAMVDGHDALDVPVKIAPDAIAAPAAIITLSDRRTVVSGTVQSGAGHAPSDYFVVIFPQDGALRQSSRRVSVLRAGADGRYGPADLPMGDYFMAAVTDFLPEDLADPTFFDALQASALKLTLAEGENKIQDLRIGG